MFGDVPAFSSFSVDDLAAAKQVLRRHPGGEDRRAARGAGARNWPMAGRVFLYPKEDHVPATFTVLNFPVDDIDKAVEQLARSGVSFEKYPDTDEKGINRGEGPDIAWFKDPAGNFLSVLKSDQLMHYRFH